jgi:hypothetical protein
MAVYQCNKCGKVVRNSTTPQNSTTCEGKHFHSWIKITDDGDATYECRNRGLVIAAAYLCPDFGDVHPYAVGGDEAASGFGLLDVQDGRKGPFALFVTSLQNKQDTLKLLLVLNKSEKPA